MPADLTAIALIALLREHPGACGMLGIVHDPKFDSRLECYESRMRLWSGDGRIIASNFRRWLTGAAVEKCDELCMETFEDGDGSWKWRHSLTWSPTGPDPEMKQGAPDGRPYDTRLHAALAALERHAKEKSNG